MGVCSAKKGVIEKIPELPIQKNGYFFVNNILWNYTDGVYELISDIDKQSISIVSIRYLDPKNRIKSVRQFETDEYILYIQKIFKDEYIKKNFIL